MRRLLPVPLAIGALLGVAAFAPTGASAAVTCSLTAGEDLAVDVTDTSPQVSIDVAAGAIRVFDGGLGQNLQTCVNEPVTTSNTGTITVTDAAAHNLTLFVSLRGGALEPGDNVDPPAGSADATGPEIETSFAAGDGNDRIELDGTDAADDFDLGQAAAGTFLANLNPAADGGARDCDDVSATDVEDVIVRGRGGEDDVNATSCQGIGAAVPLDPATLRIEGGNQKDLLRGGPGADLMLGGTDDDNIGGGAGDDSMDGERNEDKMDGGIGADAIEGGTEVDRAFYDDRTTPVTASIGNGGADDGGDQDASGGARDNIGFSVEHITTGSAGDNVTGSSVVNSLDLGSGDDVGNGGEGDDDINGSLGNDTLDGGGGADEVRGQEGSDTGRGGSGKDRVLGGPQADKLFGGPGADLLRGEGGRDSMKGQGGNDRIEARDKKRDKRITCGGGKAKKESATVDKVDPKAKSC